MSEWTIDWRRVVDEAIRRRKSEGLSQRSLAELAGVSVPTVNAFEQGEIRLRFERVIAILEVLGLFVQPSAPDSFDGFCHKARARWQEITAVLPERHPARQPHGHSEQAYALDGLPSKPTIKALQAALENSPRTSGWPPFWIPTRADLHPVAAEKLIECWLGRPDANRLFEDAAHSDFWQVNRDGFAYLHRGYQEDGPDNFQPGSIFDLTLPIWRIAELLIHAAALARSLGGDDNIGIRLSVRYSGLEGRELVNWTNPLLRSVLGERHRARSGQAVLEGQTSVAAVENNLAEVAHDLLIPLYERFDGYQLTYELVSSQVEELRRQAANR